MLSGGKFELVEASGFNYNQQSSQLATLFLYLKYYKCVKSSTIIEFEKFITVS